MEFEFKLSCDMSTTSITDAKMPSDFHSAVEKAY